MKILSYISTRNRYDKTLACAMMSIALQTRKPDKFILFDDSDKPLDLREISVYKQIFRIFDEKKIPWEVLFGEKRGQHWNHQRANKMDFDACWRLDDDEVAQENVLEILEENLKEDVGAVGGLVLAPNNALNIIEDLDNSIEKFNTQPNLQWFRIQGNREVDHLYSSFLYRSNVVDYNLALSKIAHTEETQFSYSLKLKGFKLLVVPKAITWHLREETGGIRDGAKEMWEEDEQIFKNWLEYKKSKKFLIILDAGLGDHIVFRSLLPDIRKKHPELLISCCYPEVFEGHLTEKDRIISIKEGSQLANIDQFNIYKFMEEHSWTKSLREAYKAMYL